MDDRGQHGLDQLGGTVPVMKRTVIYCGQDDILCANHHQAPMG